MAQIRLPAGKQKLAPGDTARQEFTTVVFFKTIFGDSTLTVKGAFSIIGR